MADIAQGGGAAPKLDELMLAMDVVDTLRHQEGLVEKALGEDSRDATLKERLRTLYEGQGLKVSDRILDDGIRALKESRFTYDPAPPSFAVSSSPPRGDSGADRGGLSQPALPADQFADGSSNRPACLVSG